MTQAVFRSVHQALHFCFLVESQAASTTSPTQAVINRLMDQAGVRRDIEGGGTIDLKGLTREQIRDQCNNVTAAVSRICTHPEIMAIWAYYAHDARKAQGISFMREWCAPHWVIESNNARMSIVWHVHTPEDMHNKHNLSLRLIGGEHGLPKSTVHDQASRIKRACRGLRENGVDRLSPYFIQQGVTADPQVENELQGA